VTEFPRFRAVADRAVLAEFGDRIDSVAHGSVLRLDRQLGRTPLPGMTEAVPAYASLLVVFDPLVTDHDSITYGLRRLLEAPAPVAPAVTPREVLVCHDADLAPDLPEVAARTGLSPEAVIAAFLWGNYRVFMYGFAPGYAYLAGVPPALHLPRKPTATRDVPAGSIIIAGPQCLVTTLTMPTGWWIIGRSPTPILRAGADRPFLFDVGDPVRFRAIPRAEFDALASGSA
jgi:inhibitor of KinA